MSYQDILKSLNKSPELWDEYIYGLINKEKEIAIVLNIKGTKENHCWPQYVIMNSNQFKIPFIGKLYLYFSIKQFLKNSILEFSLLRLKS